MSKGTIHMPTNKIIALAIRVIVLSVLGILTISGSIKMSAEFWSGIIMGMLLSLGLAALFGVPRLARSPKRGTRPPTAPPH